MIRTITHTLLVAAGLALAAPAYSAGYLKIGDIKGEATDERHTATPGSVQSNEPAKPGLLLPAIQKAQEPDRDGKAKKKGNVEYNWKVEEGQK
jgi:hypothetical protein